MVQFVKQTHKQKMAMYMKLSKKDLATMLINCNEVIDSIQPSITCEQTKKETKSDRAYLDWEPWFMR